MSDGKLSLSFRTRLAVSLALFGLGILMCVTGIYYLQVKAALFRTLDDALKSVARAELASALDDPDEGLHVHEVQGPLDSHFDTGLEEVSWIVNEEGVVVARSRNMRTEEVERIMSQLGEVPDEEVLSDHEVSGVPYRLLAAGFRFEGKRYIEVLGLSRAPVLDRLSEIQRQLLWLVGISALAISAMSYGLSRRLTELILGLSRQLGVVGETGKLQLVKPKQSVDQEIQVLYTTVEEMLHRLDESMDTQKRFISDASHEIRAPLTNLRVALDVCLRRERSNEEYLETLQVCQSEVVRLGQLAERLLTLNRIDSGLYQLEPRDTDLSEMLKSAVEACAPRAAELGVSVDRQLQSPARLRCDAEAIRQVVDNLLDNALRHAPKGSAVKLELAQDGARWKVAVTNTGCHLTGEQSEKVFQRFYRVDASRQRDTGGAGLGLAIARGFVEAHGGEIGVDLGQDSLVTFWFGLPVGTTE